MEWASTISGKWRAPEKRAAVFLKESGAPPTAPGQGCLRFRVHLHALRLSPHSGSAAIVQTNEDKLI